MCSATSEVRSDEDANQVTEVVGNSDTLSTTRFSARACRLDRLPIIQADAAHPDLHAVTLRLPIDAFPGDLYRVVNVWA